MPSTLTIQNALTYCQTLIKNRPLSVNNLEPGLSMGNIVLGRMLGPPMAWRFNRFNFSFPVAEAGGTDYQIALPNLGRIETQWLTDANGNIVELSGAVSLAKTTAVRRPTTVSPQYDDNQGNVTFRLNAVPDQAYTAWFDGQQKAPLLDSYARTFGPVPDEFAYLFLKGMLAEAALIVNDARFQIWEREFVGGLLYTQDGLDAQARSIFMEQMLRDGRTSLRSQTMGQGAAQARTL